MEEQSKELDRIFWEKVNAFEASEEEKNFDEGASDDWREIKNWLNFFDTQMKSAIVLMCRKAADEAKPFQEKYDAREILQKLADEIKPAWLEQSDVIKVVKALIYNRLGQNFYDAEEISESERKMQESLKTWL